MSDLDQLAARLARDGYFVHLHHTGSAWSCTLQAGVDVMDGRHPRPHGVGKTSTEALRAAIQERDERKAA